MTHRPVVIGLQGLQPAAMSVAMREAVSARTYLRVVHCIEESAAAAGHAVLDRLRPQAPSVGRQPPLTFELAHSGVVDALEHRSRSACALVLGSQTLDWYTSLTPGDIVARLTRHADSPVFVVPGGSSTSRTEAPVVVCAGDSPVGDRTWQFAFTQARERRSVLRVEAQRDASRAALTEVLVPWRRDFPDVEVDLGPVGGADSAGCGLVVVQRPDDRSVPFERSAPTGVALAAAHGCGVAVVPRDHH